MTERDPNELYDALRDRLADYGQEPPAHLWAGIRAQLPPPVALPQTRPRHWAGRALTGGLAAGLVSVACLSGWWWHSTREAARTGQETALAASAEISPATSTSPDDQRLVAPAHPAATAAAHPATTPERLAAAQPGAGLTTASAPTAAAATTQPAAASPHTAGSSVAADAGSGLAAADAAGTYPHNAPAALLPAREEGRPATTRRPRKATALLAAAPASRFREGSARHSAGTAEAGRPASATGAVAATAAVRRRITGPETLTGQPAMARAQAAAGAGLSARTTKQAAALAGSQHTAERPAALAGLPLHPVALARPNWPRPAVRAGAGTFPHPALLPPQRWTLQLLAGPSLTYRRLGAQPELAQPAPANVPALSTFYDQQGAPTSIETLERPAVGFGAQLELRRVLSGRWAVSSGVGYQEYATSLELRTVRASSQALINSTPRAFADSAATSVRLRDTYRFVTVPLRFSYQLGAASPRFRYAVLGGAEVAVYLGGNSSEGNACACQTTAESRPVYPYQRLSLAFNLGLDLRYRLAPQWELLAQPTATTFLTSLARPVSGLAPRYLLGTGLQLGVSYGLR